MKSPREHLGATYRSLSQRLGKQLLDEVLREPNLRPALTLSRVGAFFLATCVYALWLAMLLGGLWLLLKSGFNLFVLPFAIVLLVMAIAARPRVPPFPKTYVTAADYPALFELVGRVAQSLHTKNVDAIVLDPDFNASIGRGGWRRRTVLYLGLPFYEMLDNPERLALFGHELAHGVNGDPVRGWYVGMAYYSVVSWFSVLHVRHSDGFVGTLVNVFMYVLSFVPLGLALAMAHVIFRDKQRAEYLADYLASQVAGKDAELALLRKTRTEAHFAHVLHSLALNPSDADFFQELRAQFVTVPDVVPEDSQAEIQYELDATHPPTEYRIKFIRERGVSTPSLSITPQEWSAVDTELRPAKKEVQQQLIDQYLRTKYY